MDNLRTMYLAIEDYYDKYDLKRIFERVLKGMIEDYLKVFMDAKIDSKLGAKRIKNELEFVS